MEWILLIALLLSSCAVYTPHPRTKVVVEKKEVDLSKLAPIIRNP